MVEDTMVDRGAQRASTSAPRTAADLDISGVMHDAVVLVVDDGATNVLLLERLLHRAGVRDVIGITDPREAVEHYRTAQPDLILLDLHMPELDGIAVLQALAAVIPQDSFTPILVLTADTTLEAKQRALGWGANDFVNKPFEQTELLLRVRNLLATRALHRELQRHNAAMAVELRAVADQKAKRAAEHAERATRIQRVLDSRAIEMVFQPIVDLDTYRCIGVEALARFPGSRPPNEWFDEASHVGLGADLELLAIQAAVDQINQLPQDMYLSVNVSPAVALDARLADILGASPARIVLELTEHASVDSYSELLDGLAQLRHKGIRIAVDDAGSGYASLRHILSIRPDIIKLDLDLTRDIDTDPARRALAASLVLFADEIDTSITAEGIETDAEAATLKGLHVRCGQGYYFGRPGRPERDWNRPADETSTEHRDRSS